MVEISRDKFRFVGIDKPMIAGQNYTVQNIGEMNEGSSIKHLFGTDNLGRDLFDRLWVGGRVSLIIAFVGTVIECLIGIIYGSISGYFDGPVDSVMMRIVEILNSIPYLIIVILIAVRLGNCIMYYWMDWDCKNGSWTSYAA